MRKPNLLNLHRLLSVSEIVFPWLVSSFSGYFGVMIGFPWMLINPCDQLFFPASLSPVKIFWVFLASVSEIDYISLDQPTSTVLTFVSGKGKVVQPMIIHKGKRVQENWVRKAPGDVWMAATNNRYVIKAKFREYGLRFAHYLRQQELNDRPDMLIIDTCRLLTVVPFDTTSTPICG